MPDYVTFLRVTPSGEFSSETIVPSLAVSSREMTIHYDDSLRILSSSESVSVMGL
jgi:hypothetical protein